MRRKVMEALGGARAYGKVFLKMTALSALMGVACGGLGGVFHHAVEVSGYLFREHGWLLYLLPLAGLAIVWLYRAAGIRQDRGANLVISSLRTGEEVPPRIAPLIFIGTSLTQLCGGSAGREGAALQIGAAAASCVTGIFRLDKGDAKLTAMCGTSGLFSAVFGTPITATLFSLEVSAVGTLHCSALYPCLVSSVTAWEVSRLLGSAAEEMPPLVMPIPDPATIFRAVVLSLLCALVSILFLKTLHLTEDLYRRCLPNPYLRAAAGGALVIAVTTLLGTREYNGAGMAVATAAIGEQAAPWTFLCKILLTALTIGAGYKGGEIVPSFAIGAAFGCAAGPLLGLDPGLAGAMGLIALFCSVVNCPVSSILLSVELFGGGRLWLFAIVCGVSYLMSGGFSLYAAQELVFSKLEDGEE